jgi:hypothetical protein
VDLVEVLTVFLDSDKWKKKGQAMIEFVMVIIVIALLVSVTCDFIPIFTAALRQQTEAHSNVGGITMLNADEGMVSQRSDNFDTDLNIPFLLQDGDIRFCETLKFPAANLRTYFDGRIDIPGSLLGPEFSNENDDGTSKLKSWVVSGAPNKVRNGIGALLDGDWIRYEKMVYENHDEQEYVYVYTMGDQLAPSAVAAIYVGPAESCPDKQNPQTTTVTIIARTAGGL